VGWQPPQAAAPYLQQMTAAEMRYGLPPGLLARVAYQESRFRDDIISGETQSPAGAVGLMQIVPRWHPGVDPTDPVASIWYAADYLARLHRKFGSWRLALAAYNWGPGNVDAWQAGAKTPPAETVSYMREVGGDLGLS